MSAEFNWWLLIVGLVAGGALTWLVLAESRRRDDEIAEEELRAEAAWIARSLDDRRLDADAAERVLRAHRRYLGFTPPDVLLDPDAVGEGEGDEDGVGDPGVAGAISPGAISPGAISPELRPDG